MVVKVCDGTNLSDLEMRDHFKGCEDFASREQEAIALLLKVLDDN